jgi:hypothetical protein
LIHATCLIGQFKLIIIYSLIKWVLHFLLASIPIYVLVAYSAVQTVGSLNYLVHSISVTGRFIQCRKFWDGSKRWDLKGCYFMVNYFYLVWSRTLVLVFGTITCYQYDIYLCLPNLQFVLPVNTAKHTVYRTACSDACHVCHHDAARRWELSIKNKSATSLFFMAKHLW